MPTITRISNSQIHDFSAVLTDALRWMGGGVELGSQWGMEDVSVETLQERYGEDEIYVAYDAEKTPVGCVLMQLLDPIYWPEETGDDSAFLHKLAVAESARGSGLAEELVQRVVMRARELGKTFLRLDCRSNRPKLCGFYERLGFKPVRQIVVGKKLEISAQLFEMKL